MKPQRPSTAPSSRRSAHPHHPHQHTNQKHHQQAPAAATAAAPEAAQEAEGAGTAGFPVNDFTYDHRPGSAAAMHRSTTVTTTKIMLSSSSSSSLQHHHRNQNDTSNMAKKSHHYHYPKAATQRPHSARSGRTTATTTSTGATTMTSARSTYSATSAATSSSSAACRPHHQRRSEPAVVVHNDKLSDRAIRRFQATGSLYTSSEMPRRRFTDGEFMRNHYYDDHILACYSTRPASSVDGGGGDGDSSQWQYQSNVSSSSTLQQPSTSQAIKPAARCSSPSAAATPRPPSSMSCRGGGGGRSGRGSAMSSRRSHDKKKEMPGDVETDGEGSSSALSLFAGSKTTPTPNLDLIIRVLHRSETTSETTVPLHHRPASAASKRDTRRQQQVIVTPPPGASDDDDGDSSHHPAAAKKREEQPDIPAAVLSDDDDSIFEPQQEEGAAAVPPEDKEPHEEEEPKTPPRAPPLSSFFPRPETPRAVPVGAHISMLLTDERRAELERTYNYYSSPSPPPPASADADTEANTDKLEMTARARRRQEHARKRQEQSMHESLMVHRDELYRKEEEAAAKLHAQKVAERERRQREQLREQHRSERVDMLDKEERRRADIVSGQHHGFKRIVKQEFKERTSIADVLALREALAKLSVFDRERILQGEEFQRSETVRAEASERSSMRMASTDDMKRAIVRMEDRLREEEELRRRFTAERLQEEHNEDLSRSSKVNAEEQERHPALSDIARMLNELANKQIDERLDIVEEETIERANVDEIEQQSEFDQLHQDEQEAFAPVKLRFDILNALLKLPNDEQAGRDEIECEEAETLSAFDAYSPARRMEEFRALAGEETDARSKIELAESGPATTTSARGVLEEHISTLLAKAIKKDIKRRKELLAKIDVMLQGVDEAENRARNSVINSEFKARNTVMMSESQQRPAPRDRRKSLMSEYMESHRNLEISSDDDDGGEAKKKQAAAAAAAGSSPIDEDGKKKELELSDESEGHHGSTEQRPLQLSSRDAVFDLTPQEAPISQEEAPSKKLELSSSDHSDEFEL